MNRLFPLPLSPCASAYRLFCWAFALPLRARLEEVVFCLCRALALSALSGGPVRRPLKVLPGKAVALGGGGHRACSSSVRVILAAPPCGHPALLLQAWPVPRHSHCLHLLCVRGAIGSRL